MEGSSKGILLLHGVGGGTTWDLKEFASFANNRGYTIWLPALPGFGTDPNDLLKVSFDDWLTTASQGIEKLQNSCSSISILGHSGGAVIGLILAAHSKEITSVVSWACPWKLKHPLVPFLPFILRIPILKKTVPEREPLLVEQLEIPVPELVELVDHRGFQSGVGHIEGMIPLVQGGPGEAEGLW